MDVQIRQRGVMSAMGAGAGLALWVLAEVLSDGWIDGRPALFLVSVASVFAGGLLVLTGPLRPLRAALSALPVAVVTGLLLALASLRYDTVDSFLMTDPWLAAFAVVFLPLPFLIAAGQPEGWRHYPTLFSESWSVVVRSAAAWVFTGVVWGVLWLSDALLGIVGIPLVDTIMAVAPLPWLITGTVLGLALAVVSEMSDVISPHLVLRLLRLLVIPVLAVLTLFVVALPLRGMDGLLGGVSVAMTLLAMSAAAATLVTTAIDSNDGAAAHGRWMRAATQALALILPVPAVLAGYAVWLRVDQHGWTPDRLFAATVAVIGLGYGLGYAGAVIARKHWMARIRTANVWMALVLLAAAILWQTPVLNAERISARSQLARFEAGKTPVAELDLAALSLWGVAGQEARSRLAEIAAATDNAELSARLAEDPFATPGTSVQDRQAILTELAQAMPLQPPGATATRDMLLEAVPDDELRVWLDLCRATMPDGRAGCVFLVADLWPGEPGEEAIVFLRDPAGYMRSEGLGMVAGVAGRHSVWSLDGVLPDLAEGEALIRSLQDAPAPVSAAPLNRLGTGAAGTGLILMP